MGTVRSGLTSGRSKARLRRLVRRQPDDVGESVDEGAETLDDVIGEHGEVGVGLRDPWQQARLESSAGLPAWSGTRSLVKAMGHPPWRHPAGLHTSDHDDCTTNSTS